MPGRFRAKRQAFEFDGGSTPITSRRRNRKGGSPLRADLDDGPSPWVFAAARHRSRILSGFRHRWSVVSVRNGDGAIGPIPCFGHFSPATDGGTGFEARERLPPAAEEAFRAENALRHRHDPSLPARVRHASSRTDDSAENRLVPVAEHGFSGKNRIRRWRKPFSGPRSPSLAGGKAWADERSLA